MVISVRSAWTLALALSFGWLSAANAATLYVAKSGTDSGNNCKSESNPCATIARGIASMAGGDTLIVGDGTYAEQIAKLPSGTASAYTTVRRPATGGSPSMALGLPTTTRTASASMAAMSWCAASTSK